MARKFKDGGPVDEGITRRKLTPQQEAAVDDLSKKARHWAEQGVDSLPGLNRQTTGFMVEPSASSSTGYTVRRSGTGEIVRPNDGTADGYRAGTAISRKIVDDMLNGRGNSTTYDENSGITHARGGRIRTKAKAKAQPSGSHFDNDLAAYRAARRFRG